MDPKIIDCGKLKESLQLLDEQLYLSDSPSVELIICGGSALIATGLVTRTICDIDV